jgi:CHASE3 domain sensor protein
MLPKIDSQPVRNLVFLGILLPSISVSVATILARNDQNRIRKSFDVIMRCSRIEDTIHQLLADIVEVEDGQRGYLLTEKRSYLESYQNARDKVSSDLDELHEQIGDNQQQQVRLKKVDGLIADKLEAASQMIDLEQTGQHLAAVRLVRADHAKKTIDAVRALVEEMSFDEKELLANCTKNLATQTQKHTSILLSLLGLNTISIVCILYLLHHLTRLRSLVKMCAWSRTIEYEGEWISFEKYLERRFSLDITHGISPAEAARLTAELNRTGPSNKLN